MAYKDDQTVMTLDRAAPMSANPCVFVVGCPRSGTTLLRRILDAHGELAIPKAETHWIPKLARSPYLTEQGAVTPELRETLQQNERYRKLGLPEDLLDSVDGSTGSPAYADLVAVIFDAYARQRGKSLAGDKTPGYARCISQLQKGYV